MTLCCTAISLALPLPTNERTNERRRRNNDGGDDPSPPFAVAVATAAGVVLQRSPPSFFLYSRTYVYGLSHLSLRARRWDGLAIIFASDSACDERRRAPEKVELLNCQVITDLSAISCLAPPPPPPCLS